MHDREREKEVCVRREWRGVRALTLALCPLGHKFRLDDTVRPVRQTILARPVQKIKAGQLALMLALLCGDWSGAGWRAGLLFCPVLELLFPWLQKQQLFHDLDAEATLILHSCS